MATYVIVGGVAGGATAAARLRRLDEHADIVLLERGAHVSFANCGLPYHIGGAIPQREALLVSTPEKLAAEFRLDVRTEHEVLAIDRQTRTVKVRRLADGGTYQQPYDALLLSPGARPLRPPIPGADLPGVHVLRDLPDMDAIKAPIDAGRVRRAVVVGGGFIGLEMAENLHARGVQVTLVEMLEQVMPPLDFELAAMLHEHLREQGVRLVLGDGLRRIEPLGEGGLRAVTASGAAYDGELVVLALGVQPESDLARAAGLEVGPRGHIAVDARMQTSDPAIYAVGDAVQVRDPVTGALTAVPLAGPANRQARIAADNIAGRDARYRGTVGTAIAKVFALTVACTGANSHTLEQQGIAHLSSITHSQDHVAYYPGATPQAIKLLYAPDDGRLLGAQVVGYNAVDRTINALATALQAGMTVYDLEHLELAYAPPYGAAKDAVNIAGYVAANRLRGDTDLATWRDVQQRDTQRTGVLDVRTIAEWQLGHVEGAVHVPIAELRERLGELDRDREWIVYCQVGRRAYIAERVLKAAGFRARNLTGGWVTYAAATGAGGCHAYVAGGEGGGESTHVDANVPGDGPMGGNGHADAVLDARGLQCPGPIMAVYRRIQELSPGQVLEVQATDPGFARDLRAWCEGTGNRLLALEIAERDITARLVKGQVQPAAATSEGAAKLAGKTMVVFSGELDKALAAFVIANGAAAMGQPVTLFFTFWGLNLLRRRERVRVRKNLVERMFGWMLPKGPDALALSRLHMGGLGTWMIKRVMRAKRVDSLPALMRMAQESGVRLIACQMSMDLMGIKPEELIDGVEIGGVATYISETDKAGATLFI